MIKNIPLDKQAHFWAGMAIYGLTVAVFPMFYAMLPVLLAAIGKELWDKRTHAPDWMDAAATAAGGVVAMAWYYGMQLV